MTDGNRVRGAAGRPPRILAHESCPVRRRLAVRQRPAPHRPRGRVRRALRRVQPVHADGRARRAHGQRHRRARHADPRRCRRGGRQRRRSSPTSYNAVIAQDLTDLGLSYDLFTRTTTRNHYAVVQELFTSVCAQRLHGRADDPRRDQPVDRPHPARPLHRGHLPDLRLRPRPAATSATTAATSSTPPT